MATHYSPKIVTDGLVLCLDAANSKSYISGSSTWSDISGNGYNGTLVNGPTSNNFGLVLDGTNDYGYISHGGSLAFNSGNFTVCVWHRNENSLTDYNGIITNDSNGDNAWKIFKDGGQSFYKARSNATTLNFPSYVVGRFHHYAYTFNAGTLQLYFDAVAGNSTTGVSNPVSNTTVAFGSYRHEDAVNLAYLTNQTIGGVCLYNRALSASEILQNYNALKGRFVL